MQILQEFHSDKDSIFIFFIIKNRVILNNNNVGSPLQLLHDTYFFLNILWKCTIVRHFGCLAESYSLVKRILNTNNL